MDSVGPRKGERVEGGGDEAGGRERELGGGAKKVRQQSAVTTTTAKGSLSCLVRVFDCTHGFETFLQTGRRKAFLRS